MSTFARDIDLSQDEAIALLDGRTAISLGLAQALSKVLGASAQFWMSRDFLYRQDAGRLQSEHHAWIESLPMSDMIRLGWISPPPLATEEAVAALRFFGVHSFEAWHETYRHIELLAAFRTSPTFESRPAAVAAWLREGERRAHSQPCMPWNPAQFRAALIKIRSLTRLGDPRRFVPQLLDICSASGVAVVTLRAPTGCRASGATQFLSADKALLLLSFRHLTDDHLWYTFFHEAGHLLLHDESQLFIDGLEETAGHQFGRRERVDADLFDAAEREADEFASNMLIPQEAQSALRAVRLDSKSILGLAQDIGVSPGIVVGQLQHFGLLRQNQLNSLKRRYEWSTSDAVPIRQPRKAR
jgi:HTH-type transcriptional regulator / antitoxin HigA